MCTMFILPARLLTTGLTPDLHRLNESQDHDSSIGDSAIRIFSQAYTHGQKRPKGEFPHVICDQ